MDIIDIKSYSLVITFLAFIGVGWWAFSPSRKKRFEEDAKLPFAEDDYINARKEHSDAVDSTSKKQTASEDAEKKGHKET